MTMKDRIWKGIQGATDEKMPLFYVVLFLVFFFAESFILLVIPALFSDAEKYHMITESSQLAIQLYEVLAWLTFSLVVFVVGSMAIDNFTPSVVKNSEPTLDRIEEFCKERQEAHSEYLNTDPPGDDTRLTLSSMAEINAVVSKIRSMRAELER